MEKFCIFFIFEVIKNILYKLLFRFFYIVFNIKFIESFYFIVMKLDMFKGKILRYFFFGEKNCLNF